MCTRCSCCSLLRRMSRHVRVACSGMAAGVANELRHSPRLLKDCPQSLGALPSDVASGHLCEPRPPGRMCALTVCVCFLFQATAAFDGVTASKWLVHGGHQGTASCFPSLPCFSQHAVPEERVLEVSQCVYPRFFVRLVQSSRSQMLHSKEVHAALLSCLCCQALRGCSTAPCARRCWRAIGSHRGRTVRSGTLPAGPWRPPPMVPRGTS
jgi:hypothetical protein